MRYAMQYAQDGAIKAWVRTNRKTVFSMEMQVTRIDATLPATIRKGDRHA